MFFQVLRGHTPVLKRQVRWNEIGAIALGDAGLDAKVRILKAVGLAVPVHQGPARAGARQKAFPAAHGQGGVARAVAKGHGLAAAVLHQGLAHRVAQLVVHVRTLEIGHGRLRLAALQAHDLETGTCEFACQHRPDQAHAQHDGIDFRQTDGGHVNALPAGRLAAETAAARSRPGVHASSPGSAARSRRRPGSSAHAQRPGRGDRPRGNSWHTPPGKPNRRQPTALRLRP